MKPFLISAMRHRLFTDLRTLAFRALLAVLCVAGWVAFPEVVDAQACCTGSWGNYVNFVAATSGQFKTTAPPTTGAYGDSAAVCWRQQASVPSSMITTDVEKTTDPNAAGQMMLHVTTNAGLFVSTGAGNGISYPVMGVGTTYPDGDPRCLLNFPAQLAGAVLSFDINVVHGSVTVGPLVHVQPPPPTPPVNIIPNSPNSVTVQQGNGWVTEKVTDDAGMDVVGIGAETLVQTTAAEYYIDNIQLQTCLPTDTTSDPKNCGGCAKTCPPGGTCKGSCCPSAFQYTDAHPNGACFDSAIACPYDVCQNVSGSADTTSRCSCTSGFSCEQLAPAVGKGGSLVTTEHYCAVHPVQCISQKGPCTSWLWRNKGPSCISSSVPLLDQFDHGQCCTHNPHRKATLSGCFDGTKTERPNTPFTLVCGEEYCAL